MTRSLLIVAIASTLFLGSNCPPAPTPTPTPAPPPQPSLAGVRFIGQQLCGPFTGLNGTFAFICGPLPTLGPTGWQLTPAWRPLDASGHQKSNRIVVLTVTTPSPTNLRIDYVPGAAVWTLRQNPPGPGQPRQIGASGEVEVDRADDGTTRTWTVTANVWLCAREVPLRFFTVNPNGGALSSTALSVVLARTDEGQCEFSSSGGGAFASGGSNRPNPPPAAGPCAGGASRRFFDVCENCTNPPDPKFNDWTGVEACDWEEILQTFDYKNPDGTPRFPKANRCQPPRQLNRVACEGA